MMAGQLLDAVVTAVSDFISLRPLPGLLPGATVAVWVWLVVTGVTVPYAYLNLATVLRWRHNLHQFQWNGEKRIAARSEILVQGAVLTMALLFMFVGLLVALTPPAPDADARTRTNAGFVVAYVLPFLTADACLLLISRVTRREHVQVFAYPEPEPEEQPQPE